MLGSRVGFVSDEHLRDQHEIYLQVKKVRGEWRITWVGASC